ncbi:MAG: hypothetical protein Q8L47_02865 [bacterium]|nr:hypothetical protein [bacterium]
MRLHRFIYNFDNKGPYIIVDDKILINQIRNVLKLKISEHTIFILEAGTEVEAELTKINNNYL